jgi:NitT/TauT family transport system permease protein
MGSKVAIIVSLVFFLMFYNVYVGIRVIDIEFVYQARIMGATRWGEIRYVILPAIMPNVMVGLKTSSVYAVIGAVIGEFIAAHAGIGFFILDASGMFNVTDIWVGVAFLMLLLLAMTGLITLAERRLLRWMPRGSRR